MFLFSYFFSAPGIAAAGDVLRELREAPIFWQEQEGRMKGSSRDFNSRC